MRANTLELACVGVDERLNEFEAFFAYAFGLSEDGNIFVEQSFGQEVTVDVGDKNLDVVRVGWFACNFFEVVALSEVEEVEIDPVIDMPRVSRSNRRSWIGVVQWNPCFISIPKFFCFLLSIVALLFEIVLEVII